MRKLLTLSLLLIAVSSIAQMPFKSETVTINGKNLYYEVYGTGEPLFLFHGGWMSSRAWLPYVDEYDDDFQVYLVDLPGHGRSYPIKDKFSVRSAAEDVNALLKYLEMDSIKGIGYSYGGDILFQLAVLNPSMVEAFIPIGGCGARSVAKEWSPATLEMFIKSASEISKAYQVSPEYIEGIIKFVRTYKAEVSDADFQKIQSKVLMVIGDDDFTVDWSEVVRARKHLPSSDLWVVPKTGHGAHEYANKEAFLKVSKAFLME